ncbi:glucose-6-phosphate isomerase [Apilactobacillus micheneri]|uniref:Glucose-6-phosphate isomerase n=1 Tax=Apilactobacillus micheneri TaxID=1899430 RepID=A0ABY2YYE2_9LACO|nr:glucose-6-phosphate isomerase [Apilactobacillus micheneri]TPR26233.1 glucose-6-phosphate isomerase [Apilactobacillus micheneri]TPR26987.1 glucose-6-phosphate isomerase [Apilactobacillus micheneri]TPR27845.1 glucose-6-phosphate isomerase [Apilactobacillus micheneri]TPR31750.1 glucose-6-phosphate isomerase [Apilactobacillus micheneri]TPR32154.1 glucose-6-phosphate isomerase [Apilactobacillus micheneri]
MTNIKFDTSALKQFVDENELKEIKPMLNTARDELLNGTGVESEMRQWMTLPIDYDKEEFSRIKQAANKIQSDSKILVVIGIGGSYLGAKMALDFLHDNFYESADSNKYPKVVFAGNSISGSYVNDLIKLIGDKDFSVNVISKSGTTTEPSIAFRIFRQLLINKYGKDEANQRIYVTTDAKNGALRQEVNENNYESFVIPNGIGGRYSVLSAVGLLPIAASGADIDQLMKGAADAQKHYMDTSLEDNGALQYAAYRNILYRKGYTNEILENYEPNLRFLAEWWKQLAGETEGKSNKGIYPSSANFSTDLHSLGQYIQQGMRNLMETVVRIEEPQSDIKIPVTGNNNDGIQYLEGKSMNYVNDKAFQSVIIAHTNGGVPNMVVNLKDQSEYSLGELIYFFEFAIAVSGYLNGINPFNQPGVEDYKSNMFALLGKPGYEDLKNKIEKDM